MKGKIFAESSNIYQDQAKVLFDYYRQAAERIVSEEERLEKEISILEEERAICQKQNLLWMLLVGVGVSVLGLALVVWQIYLLTQNPYYPKGLLVLGALLLIGGIVLIVLHTSKNKKKTAQIGALTSRIEEYKRQHSEIFRDYKVSKLGVAYVPIADQIKYEDKSFIVDYTGAVPESEVTLQLSRQNDLMVDTIERLERLASEAPIVETSEEPETIETDDYSTSIQELNQNDYLGGLERSLRTISYCMSDLDTTSVSLPLVADQSAFFHFINEFTTAEVPAQAKVIPVFQKDKYQESVTKFQELNRLKDSLSNKTQQFEDVLKALMVTISNSVQAISSLKIASVDKVVIESNKLLFQMLKAPYNQYSPMLEFDEIERIRNERFDYSEDVQSYKPFNLKQSSRVRFNLMTGLWTAEDGNTTNLPFGVHQLYEEIVAPVVQNLMEENRLERLKIYNHIKDQKIDYLNKWHQDTDAFYRANRAESSDIINLMQESLREYVAAYNTLISLKRTEDSMVQSGGDLDATVTTAANNTEETLAAFEMQSQEFQKTQLDFEDYMERLKEDIDLKAENFGYVEYYDAKLRDGYSHDMAVASSEVHTLDDRRKTLATINPLFAKNSDLPPQPHVEDVTFEHIALNLPAITQNALAELESAVLAEPVAVAHEPIMEEYEETVAPVYENEALDVAEDDAPTDDVTAEEVLAAVDAILGDEEYDEEGEEYDEDAEAYEDEENDFDEDEDDVDDEDFDEDEEEAEDDEDDELDEDEEIEEEEEFAEEADEQAFVEEEVMEEVVEEPIEEPTEEVDLVEEAFEDGLLTLEELQSMDDDDLREILTEFELPFDAANFDRNQAIAAILELQDSINE